MSFARPLFSALRNHFWVIQREALRILIVRMSSAKASDKRATNGSGELANFRRDSESLWPSNHPLIRSEVIIAGLWGPTSQPIVQLPSGRPISSYHTESVLRISIIGFLPKCALRKPAIKFSAISWWFVLIAIVIGHIVDSRSLACFSSIVLVARHYPPLKQNPRPSCLARVPYCRRTVHRMAVELL